MPWLRIDDRVRTHPKIVLAGPGAAWFWFCGICYCREHLTDGFIPDGILATLCPGVGLAAARRLAGQLVSVNLWHTVERGYQIHDFLDWNPPRAEVIEKQREERERKQRERAEREAARKSVLTDGLKTSERTTEAVLPDAHVRAVARGSGLGYGSGSSSGSSGEESRETPRIAPLIPRGEAAKWGVVHGSHVTGFCDWMCLPSELALQFAARIAEARGLPSPDMALPDVLVWARGVRANGIVPTGKMFDFWNAQWEITHGSSKPVQDGAAGRHARSAKRLSAFVENG